MKTWKFFLNLALATALALSSMPSAVFALGSNNGVNAKGATLTMYGEDLFTITSSAGGYDPLTRARIAQDNLDNALVLSANKGPSAVGVHYVYGTPIITLGGRMILSVDRGSAHDAGMTLSDLAHSWADTIKNKLSNTAKVDDYLGYLVANLPVSGSNIAKIVTQERMVAAPVGTILPITLLTAFSSETAKPGDIVEATVQSDVPIGGAFIPAGSRVSGKMVELKPGLLAVQFDTVRTPSGTTFPIVASVISEYVVAKTARPVCTMAIPAGRYTDCRVPALVAIGQLPDSHGLVLRRGINLSFESGQLLQLELTQPQSVAVIVQPGG